VFAYFIYKIAVYNFVGVRGNITAVSALAITPKLGNDIVDMCKRTSPGF